MARKPLTKEQIAARTAKAQATKAAKKKAALELMGETTTRKPTKIRKKRTMTAAQKKAAAERLAAARKNRGPSQNKMIDEHVRNLPDDNPLSLKNVREWIKENKQLLSSIKTSKMSKDAAERLFYQRVETYVFNLESYLRNGVYLDMFYGSQMQNKIQHRVVAMAYNKDGTPKRTVGYWYPDIGLYTEEMAKQA